MAGKRQLTPFVRLYVLFDITCPYKFGTCELFEVSKQNAPFARDIWMYSCFLYEYVTIFEEAGLYEFGSDCIRRKIDKIYFLSVLTV
jgi:hypothetical protein